jgi:L-alanine-DL-glutamate epimerase-like enolase superfamily enzyme
VKIAKLETFSTADVGVVKLTADSGDVGWGQLSPYHSDISASVFHRQVAPWALGREISDWETLFDEVLEIEFKFPGSYVRRALGGLDTAVWDLRGRLEGKSVCELLGGTPRGIDVYASSMRRDIAPAADAARLAVLQQEFGYRAVKVRIGRENGHDVDEWPGRTEDIIASVPSALDPATALMVDANCGYTPATAIEVGRRLDDHGFGHFEEPCPYWEYEQTCEVRRGLADRAIRVAGGEQDCDLSTWRRLIELGVFDLVQPDLLYLGGITPSMRVASLSAAAGYPCLPHSANLALGVVFTLHYVGAIGNGLDLVEWSIEGPEYYPWQYGLYDPVPAVVDGRVRIPDGPGWGVDIRPSWLESATRTTSEL